MKIFLRTLLLLALIVWLGAEVFFPIVAATVFNTLRPDTHTAGRIVGSLLTILHGMGFACGLVAIGSLIASAMAKIVPPKAVLAPIVLLCLMIGLTLYSQCGIIPAMERDRIAAGGAIDTADGANPARIHFKHLHDRSEHTEGLILLLGLSAVVLIAKTEG